MGLHTGIRWIGPAVAIVPMNVLPVWLDGVQSGSAFFILEVQIGLSIRLQHSGQQQTCCNDDAARALPSQTGFRLQLQDLLCM